MSIDLGTAIHELYAAKTGVLIIGLTGRTGSGCTTVSKILEAHDFSISPRPPQNIDPEGRKLRIVKTFVERNWQSFTRVSVTPLIASFLLQKNGREVVQLLKTTLGITTLDSHAEVTISAEVDNIRGTYRSQIDKLTASGKLKHAEVKGMNNYLFQQLPAFVSTLKSTLGGGYTAAFQRLGEIVRTHGDAYIDGPEAKNVFAIAHRITYAIEAHQQGHDEEGGRYVIDAVRNPYEGLWLKEHLQNFYLVAINTPNEDRIQRLTIREGLSESVVSGFDEREYPKSQKKLPKGFDALISQDIQTCIEKADIHLHNPGYVPKDSVVETAELRQSLARYVALMLRPGLVTPTWQERSMQVAYVAKFNSGCISRQVGATVTGADGAILSIGWNDVPKGQVSCLLRDRKDMVNGSSDLIAFSEYELKNKKFREFFAEKFKIVSEDELKGRSQPFCFKDAYNEYADVDNQVFTRSLHAEENAFLQLAKRGGSATAEGKLFSTASPCELCAKKAFQMGMTEIYYIDPYPGISRTQILASGEASSRPAVKLFQGAIGAAYHRLYEPIMSTKDELFALSQPKQ